MLPPKSNYLPFIVMAFGPKYKSKKIQVDISGVSADSPEVIRRLERIERNYTALEGILDELESRIELDDRLTESIESDDHVFGAVVSPPSSSAPLVNKPR